MMAKINKLIVNCQKILLKNIALKPINSAVRLTRWQKFTSINNKLLYKMMLNAPPAIKDKIEIDENILLNKKYKPTEVKNRVIVYIPNGYGEYKSNIMPKPKTINKKLKSRFESNIKITIRIIWSKTLFSGKGMALAQLICDSATNIIIMIFIIVFSIKSQTLNRQL